MSRADKLRLPFLVTVQLCGVKSAGDTGRLNYYVFERIFEKSLDKYRAIQYIIHIVLALLKGEC